MQDNPAGAGTREPAEMMPKGEPEVWRRDWAYRVN